MQSDIKAEQKVHREVDQALYEVNRSKFPWEKLEPYRGQHIAFNWDGTEIIASASSYGELYDKLEEMGVPPECAVASYVDEY